MLAQGVNNLTTNSKSGNSSKKPNDTPLNDQDQDDTSDHRVSIFSFLFLFVSLLLRFVKILANILKVV